MNEILDRLLMRFYFALIIIFLLAIFKYAHQLFYPVGKRQFRLRLFPLDNPANNIHLFSRIIGISIILTSFSFTEEMGIAYTSLDFIVWTTATIILYLSSIYIMESIVLYNFDFFDEISRRKNLSYAIVSFAISIGQAFLMKRVVVESEQSLVLLAIIWLYSLVFLGLFSILYKYLSKYSFNRYMIQQSVPLAISFSGFFFGSQILIQSSLTGPHTNIVDYGIGVALNIVLGLILAPIFYLALHLIFRIQPDPSEGPRSLIQRGPHDLNLGWGFYEASIFLIVSLLTSILIERIDFGTLYPFF